MKKYKILFSSHALLDMREARTWYIYNKKGRQKIYWRCKKTISSIQSNPYFASNKFENIRTAACETFPYAVHYEIDEAENLVRNSICISF